MSRLINEENGLPVVRPVLVFNAAKEKGKKEVSNVPHLTVIAEQMPRNHGIRHFANTIGRGLGSLSAAVCRIGLTFFESEID